MAETFRFNDDDMDDNGMVDDDTNVNYKLLDRDNLYSSFLEFSINCNNKNRLVYDTAKVEQHIRDLDVLADMQDEPFASFTRRIKSGLMIGKEIAMMYCPVRADVSNPVRFVTKVNERGALRAFGMMYTDIYGIPVYQDLNALREVYLENQAKINDLEAKHISSAKEIQSLNMLIDERERADLQHAANSRFRDRNGPGYILTLKLEGEDWKKNASDKLDEYSAFARNKQKRPYSKYTEIMVSWLDRYIRASDSELVLSEKSDPVYVSVTVDLSGRFKAIWLQRSKTIVQDIACPKITVTTNGMGIPFSMTYMIPKSHRLITIDLRKDARHSVFEAPAVNSEKAIISVVENALRVCSRDMEEEFGITPNDTASKIIMSIDSADLVHSVCVSFIKGDTGEETYPVSIPIRPFKLSQPFIPCVMNFGNTSFGRY